MLSGLYTALSGMNAQRRVLDVTAHNVANEATDGFHRQRVELKPAGVASVAAVFAGTGANVGGVDVVDVTRITDQLAEDRLVHESSAKAGTDTLRTNMERIELAFLEPSEDGIAALLDDFWGGWTDLSSLPGDPAIRSQMLERSQTLIDALHRASADLDQIELTARNDVISLADDVNDLADRIAQLNSAIAGSAATPNDLLDQRDVLLKDLAELTGAVGRPGPGGQVDVSIGGRTIVSGTIVQQVDGAGGVLRWVGDGSVVATPPSRAASLVETIDVVVPRYRTALDDVAAAFVTEVNAVHSVGYDTSGTTGSNFFDPLGVTASSIAISVDVAGQPNRIAAGAPVFPGPTAPGALDGEQARAIAGLADSSTGPAAAYRSMVADLGVAVRAARRRDDIQGQVTTAAEAQTRSVGGVSIDEEMANLIAAQRAYEASARVLTTVDQLLGVLMSEPAWWDDEREEPPMRVTNSMVMTSSLRDINQALGRLQSSQTSSRPARRSDGPPTTRQEPRRR